MLSLVQLMQLLRSQLPSLNALWAFEASARHLSFTRAAEELGITQPAVSQSIKQLERSLGSALFARHHRQLALTQEGERFLRDVNVGLGHIQSSVSFLHGRKNQNRSVTISVSTALATHWLLPRAALFELEYPNVDLRFQTNARDIDLVREGIELGIRQQSPQGSDYESDLFANEEVWAVCSPKYAENLKLPITPQALKQQRLIHLDEPHRTPMTWETWFAANNVELTQSSSRLTLNDYAIVLQAALAGQGVSLGWTHIIEPLLKNGQLVKVCSAPVKTQQPFFLVRPKNLVMTEETSIVRNWLLREAKQS